MEGKKQENLLKDKEHKILFAVAAISLLGYLLYRGEMISSSGDATDIWNTITSFYSADPYPSYVLYKGMLSVYPYVWFYQAAHFLGLNDFFFIMIYHAVLYGYLVVYGIPNVVQKITRWNPRLWQQIGLILLLTLLWWNNRALTSLMVDLPSCALFFLSINSAIKLPQRRGWRKGLNAAAVGILCGLCANISGQYSVAALCVLVYAVVQLVPLRVLKISAQRIGALLAVLLLFFGMFAVKLGNQRFMDTFVAQFEERGTPIASANVWMERALISMLDSGRMFYGPTINTNRGMAILEDIYGEEAEANMELAKQGGFGWKIKDYFWMVLHYPVDCAVQYVDRAFLALSVDLGRLSVLYSTLGYTLLYLAIITAVRSLRRLQDLFHAEFWLVAGAFASIIPVLVMTAEMRYAMSLQGMLYGIALMGPVLPCIFSTIRKGGAECVSTKSLSPLLNKTFPWELVFWAVFILLCLTHLGSLYAQSEGGASLLFSWV